MLILVFDDDNKNSEVVDIVRDRTNNHSIPSHRILIGDLNHVHKTLWHGHIRKVQLSFVGDDVTYLKLVVIRGTPSD